MNNNMVKTSFLNALGTFAYIVFVSFFMQNAERFFGKMDKSPLGPVVFLTLFTLSAAIAGGLVVGKPVMLYIDNKKKEAVMLFCATLAWLAIFLSLTLLFILVN